MSSSSLGTTDERIQLIVEEDTLGTVVPNIVVEDRVVTVAAGNRAEMRCFVRGTTRPVELRWVRAHNQSLPATARVENGVLYIDDVKPHDSGEYQCLGVVDGQAVVFEARARLAVVGKLIETAVVVVLLSSLIIILLALLTARYLGKR